MRFRLFFLFGLLQPFCAAPLAAQTDQPHLSAIELFAVADAARAERRIDDALAIYDALSRDPDVEIRSEARFRKGMLLADQKRYTDAAIAFRALLDEKPKAARVRLELARILALIGDEGAARRELRQAQAAGLPPEVAQVVDQFAGALRSRKRFGGFFELALAPDSNVNRATDARTLDTIIAPLTLSRDARARSGLGLKPSGQAYLRMPLSPGLTLVPRVSGAASLYRDHQFDDISGSTLLGVEWQLKRDRLSPALGYTWRWYGRDLYARTQTASVDWLHPLGSRSQLTASASASRARYILNDLQDGAIYDLGLSFEHAFGARAGGSLSLSSTRQTARDPGYATVSGGMSVLGWREIGRATVYASAGLRRTEGDERLFLFPDRRREWLYNGLVGVTMRKLTVAGFAPVFRVRYERNSSTVGIYDYKRLAGEVGITRAF